MKFVLPAAAALTLALSANALAQSTTTTPSGVPSATPSDSMRTPSTTLPSTTLPSTTSPSATTGSSSTPSGATMTMTDAEAKNWVDKPIYSSDNKNIGEVAALNRDASGKVVELHADIGGFLGIGETRVKVEPAQFTTSGDRIMLNMTSEQVKSLPKLAK